MSQTSTKPYLLRAIYEWCTDNGYTPYLAVKVDSRARVPLAFVKNGEIVLNISFDATSGLKMENDSIQFSARFGGVAREIYVPVDSVLAIYASENGQGMAFDVVLPADQDAHASPQDAGEASAIDTPPAAPALTAVPSPSPEQASGDSDDEPPKKGGRPTLTRIK